MKKLLTIGAAILLLAACAKKEDDLKGSGGREEITIRATTEPETRTTVQNGGTQVYWEPADCISVFFKGTAGYFIAQNNSLAETAEFKGSLPVIVGANEGAGSVNYLWGLYPYSREAKWVNSNDGGYLTTRFPNEQYARAGGFAKQANFAIGRSTSFDLAFYNVTGGLRFTLVNEGIDEIRFKVNGEFPLTGGDWPIAGDISVGFTAEGQPQAAILFNDTATHSTEIILHAPENEGTFQTGVLYYLSLIPMEMTEGFSMEFHKTDGTVGTRTTSNKITVKRGVYGNVNNIDNGVVFADEKIVDLGLSVKWAKFNLGASAPEEFGDYFAWGETAQKISANGSTYWSYDWSMYRWCDHDYSDENHLTKYYGSSSYGATPDKRTLLEPEDDAACENWAGNWRMPTAAEWQELYDEDNCNWERFSINDIPGYKVTSKKEGYTDKWIFLPQGGWYSGTVRDAVLAHGFYWSSNNNPDRSCYAYCTDLDYYALGLNNVQTNRCYGLNIRPVLASPESVSWVKLNHTRLELLLNQSVQLTAEVLPASATNKNVTWSSNSDAISVSDEGVVTAVKPGGGTVYVTTEDGNRTAGCEIFVSIAVPQKVDLGLSVLWADMNLGASTPLGYGSYFAWGETSAKSRYNWSTYEWCDGSESSLTKYNGQGQEGNVLLMEDDAAFFLLGGSWRMPTEDEIEELINECTWEWTSQNNVDGYKVSGKGRYVNNSIFLPAAGYVNGTSNAEEGWGGEYWSSSLYPSYMSQACKLDFMDASWIARISETSRCYGLPIRPVWSESVTGVTLNKTTLTLELDKTEQLTATVLPENATNKAVQWQSSNPSVASVDQDGKVTAKSIGSATIIVTTVSGGKVARCAVSVVAPTPEYVDLGLSMKWATFNLGAMRPEEYGDYIAWGETSPKADYSWRTYSLCNLGNEDSLVKYNFDPAYGTTDYRYLLEPEDDAVNANVKWGGAWRMPNDDDWYALKNNCTWTWEKRNGVYGYKVSGKGSYANNSIFLPAGGFINGTDREYAGTMGQYWMSNLYENAAPTGALSFMFEDGNRYSVSVTRSQGRLIRPVYAPATFVSWVILDETAITLPIGGDYQFTATILPATATNKRVSWTSDNPDVVSVDENGHVTTHQRGGEAIITVTTADGLRKAGCKVSVVNMRPDAIDLGLSVKWANMNVGAENRAEFGDYFAWGETEPKGWYDSSTYKWCEGSLTTLTKYNNDSSYGIVDNKMTLDLEDDAARYNWGGGWRTPTVEEWDELFNNCDYAFTTVDGIPGFFMQSKKPGYTDKWIFLPAGGFTYQDQHTYRREAGYYMIASKAYEAEGEVSPPSQCFNVFFNEEWSTSYTCGGRVTGHSVRPVIDK